MGAGRPPIGERAMTPAEKQRRYRERKFGNKPPVTKKAQAKPDEKDRRIRELEAQLAALATATKETTTAAQNLSMTAQQKVDAAIRQHKRELEAQFEDRVNAAGRELLSHNIKRWLGQFKVAEAKIKDVEAKIGRYKPIISKRTFRVLMAGVQPDRGGTHAAAVEFNDNREAIEAALCGSEA